MFRIFRNAPKLFEIKNIVPTTTICTFINIVNWQFGLNISITSLIALTTIVHQEKNNY